MRKPIALFLHIVLFFILVVAHDTDIQAQSKNYFLAGGRKVNVDNFDESVKNLMNGIGIPGLSLAIIDDEKIAYAHTYGYKELKQKSLADQKTIFEVASLSKSFLVFVAFKLVDQGLLDLDKPMFQYLRLKALEHDKRYELITPRMILSHSSGIENWSWDFDPDVLEIVSEPGKRYVYSGEGFQYLAKVVEKIVGKNYEAYVREMVFDPLNLKDTYACYDSLSPSNYAIGYDNFGIEIEKWKNKQPWPASGMHLTASDYAKLVIATFNTKNISKRSRREMLKPKSKIAEAGIDLYYGLGYEVLYTDGDTIVMHGGNNDGFKSQLFYSVVNKRGFVYLANSDLGKSISSGINDLSVKLNIKDEINLVPWAQYPTETFDLLKVYTEKGSDSMILKMDQIKSQKSKLKEKTLIELSLILMAKDMDLTHRLLNEYVRLNDKSAMGYYLLGQVNMASNNFIDAYQYFKKAEELDFLLAPVAPDRKKCEAQLAKK